MAPVSEAKDDDRKLMAFVPEAKEEDMMMQSAMTIEEIKKVEYFNQANGRHVDQKYVENLVNLMNMGFMDFKKNLEALQAKNNNIGEAINCLF
mmetsp:Transcript_16738/g.28438  ORF Transcript_16738/g.28438 Transcript_16738/m.28438 type:complete len:93 (-) Transcript_16738:129-407(-)